MLIFLKLNEILQAVLDLLQELVLFDLLAGELVVSQEYGEFGDLYQPHPSPLGVGRRAYSYRIQNTDCRLRH